MINGMRSDLNMASDIASSVVLVACHVIKYHEVMDYSFLWLLSIFH